MPDSKEISALTTAESISASDLFETALPNAMTETGYVSRKVTLGTIANFLFNTLQFSNLHTTVKNIIGAINELAQGSGQSLDTLNDVDIDDQTLTNGQGIVYDATAQKWKNGAVAGGGHTYSTTEQVVGTWIDGSTIYECSHIFETEILVGQTWFDTSWVVPNIDKILGVEAMTEAGTFWSLSAAKNSNNEIRLLSFRTNDNCNTKYLTIRYTKSST